jgi:hypothetical protein
MKYSVMAYSIPVLIITYNRPSNLEKILDQTYSFGVRNFYIAVDGSKNRMDTEILSENGRIIKQFFDRKSIKVKVWFRTENLGLTQSMLSAIDWFFTHESKGIILEDDLQVTKSFFEFAQHGLEIYKSNNEVFMVTGNQFSSAVGPLNGVSVANYPLIWGWATWAYQWIEFRNILDKFKVPKNYAKTKRNIYYFWKLGYLKSMHLQNQSWAILLATYMRFSNLVTVIPNSNLVSNVGFGGVSTNTLLPDNSLQIAATEMKIIKFELTNVNNLTKFLESHVYRISLKHYLLGIKIMLFMFYRTSTHKNLIESLNALKIKSRNEQKS